MLLLLGTQAAMARRDLDLHSCAPCGSSDFPPPIDERSGPKKLTPGGPIGQDNTGMKRPGRLRAHPDPARSGPGHFPAAVPGRMVLVRSLHARVGGEGRTTLFLAIPGKARV